MKAYHSNIFYSEDDDGYISDIPDLKHCSAFGTTQEEAIKEAVKAKDAWLKTARSNNTPIPIPQYRPAIYQIV